MGRAKKMIIKGKLECSKCKEMLNISEFTPSKSNSAGFSSQCRECHNNSTPKKTKRRKGIINDQIKPSNIEIKQLKLEKWNERLQGVWSE